MKYSILVLMMYLSYSSLLYSQENYLKLSEGTNSYRHFHCDCFQIGPNDSIFFRENKISSIYKGWDFTKYEGLNIGAMLNDLNKHFLLINNKIFNKEVKNEKKVRFLHFNFYKDSNSYYQLAICIGYNSMFESQEDSSDFKIAFTIKDYCAYFEIVDIDNNINGYYELIKILKPEKGSKREKDLISHINEEKKLKKKIDEITEKIKKGKIVLPSSYGKQN